MTLSLSATNIDRPDWTTVQAVAGVIYQAVTFPFTADVESDAFPVWPWSTIQLGGAAGGADLQVTIRCWLDQAKTTSIGSYAVTCAAGGNYHTSFPTASPFVSFLVHQLAPAFNNTITLRAILSELAWTQLSDKQTGPVWSFTGNIGAAATLTLNAGNTWDGDCDFFLYTASASATIQLWNQKLDGTITHHFRDIARGPGPFNLRFRSQPSPLHLTVVNNDGVAQLCTVNCLPVLG